ncbi:MAG: aldo/keto reductase, partial [Nitrosopumilaceae archaeon]|nr:aldo/keto reductase [Nitrosopumilaceae archaeon]NIP10326.1 aldo/keto reductase [Nitrosopumilaceae archaeon]NIS95189.1 aldo/keto reductase [Nitrosopumilaceae archaeon]
KRKQGKIKFYGMATWECFRADDNSPQYLSLQDTFNLAQEVGGKDHGFRFIQLPYNMHYDQALLKQNQKFDGSKISILEASSKLGIGVFTSVPFMQGRLLSPGVMPEFNNLKPSIRALQFIRSTPGVLAPLVGQKTKEHVSENLEIMKIPPIPENLEIMKIPPIPEDKFLTLVKQLTS